MAGMYHSAVGWPEAVGGANALYSDDTCLIMAGGIKDEPVQWLIQNLDELRLVLEDRNAFTEERILDEEMEEEG